MCITLISTHHFICLLYLLLRGMCWSPIVIVDYLILLLVLSNSLHLFWSCYYMYTSLKLVYIPHRNYPFIIMKDFSLLLVMSLAIKYILSDICNNYISFLLFIFCMLYISPSFYFQLFCVLIFKVYTSYKQHIGFF